MSHAATVITVSDGVASGERADQTGDALVRQLREAGWDVTDHVVVADGGESVASALVAACDGFAGLVATTGGTGFGPRDLTPEGTLTVIERAAPGLAEAMRRVSDTDDRRFGMLTRGVAGVRGQALVLNLPGSTSGATECLAAVLPAIPHALDLLSGGHPH